MRYLILLALSLTMLGCGDVQDAPMSPEDVARNFLTAIYVDRDVEQALPYVTPQIQKVMKSYHIAASVQRYMIGLSMTDVTLTVEDIDIDFFRKFSDETTVVIKMTGKKGGQDWIDDRSLRLKKTRQGWIISEILPDTGKINKGSY
ncbi:hypothetical protein L9G74_04820 [Shewanella sp. C32]|uniref:Lipoprotein n=1 Tax=Shewanella electrica TaxID=515560 RepID=A0ABT2FID4_9GAMM|nr:hypothetical protein [Shewanella electrica]MCH1923657.1 hypothetical protein [Shewanella electrica]MCS4555752.1 hypothetical protein [Shewanella electrica]